MNILILLGHPGTASFNHAIAHRVEQSLRAEGHAVVFHDLCSEGFDPALPKQEMPQGGPIPRHIQQHCDELKAAEGIVIVHPNWWGQPPAILKGWIDRVFRPGIAYRFEDGDYGEGVPIGLLQARAVLILNTSNTPDGREKAVFGDPLELIWKRCIFDLCGVSQVYRRTFSVVVTSTAEQRTQWLEESQELARSVFRNGAPNTQQVRV
jgi:putative NADPH-quinone reductase